MKEKIPITNKPINYNPEKPKENRFVWFSVKGDIYNRFRDKNELPYLGEISYNFFKDELGVIPNTNDESWTDKEDYSLKATGTYAWEEDGYVYVRGNGNYKLNPCEKDAKELSKKTGLEFRVKE